MGKKSVSVEMLVWAFFGYKNRIFMKQKSPQRSHCGGAEDVAEATRRRRGILRGRIPFCWEKKVQREN